MEGIGELIRRLRRDGPARDLALYLGLGGPLAYALCLLGREVLSPQESAFFDAALLALYFGGLIFILLHGTVRRGGRRIAELRADGERFRALTTLSADWFWESDAGHRLTWMSGGASLLTFFGSAPTYGRRLWEIPGVEIEPGALAAHLERVQAQLPFFDLEIATTDARGARQIHIVSGQLRRDAAGRFRGYHGVGRDVTEQRAAERKHAEAKARLERALAGGSLAEWDSDIESDGVYLGQGWTRFLGREPAAGVGIGVDLLELVHPEDRAAVRQAYFDCIKGTVPAYLAEYRVRTQDGGWKWLHSVGRVTARGADGRALRMSGVVSDVDERKRAEHALRDAEARYRTLVALAPDGIVVHSGGVIEYANAAAARLLKAGVPGKLVGLRLEELVHPDEVERFRERLEYVNAGPGSTRFERRRLRCLDGSEVTAEIAGVSFLEQGRLVVQAVYRDVTEERKAREALAEREQRFRDVVEASGGYVWETDAAWRYTYLSERVEAVLGYERAELLGRAPREFMPLGEDRAVEAWFTQHAAGGKAFRDLMHRSITKSGRVIWQSVSGVPVRDAAGAFRGYRGTAEDVTARKQAEERIEFLATRDALTGLPNRQLLADHVNQAIAAAARSRGQLALLSLDLDRFKLINDALGHQAGDALLRAIAERLSNTLRREGALARLGGDAFVLLWDGVKSAADAGVIAQRILGTLARPFTIESRALGAGASIGISLYPADGRDFGELLKNADTALHHAKESGRGSYRFFSPALMARAAERLALENDLRAALVRGELLLHWQPVVRGRPGAARIVGAEALVRWRHPERGLLLPEDFIPLAEECGLIRAVGEWTLERALSRIGAWQKSLPAGLWFALNVSALELAEGGAYVERLAASLKANSLDGSRLELEVTERVLMPGLADNVETLKRIGALGVRFAIDDFGTGYSSLAYLRLLPIDKLKIDRSFLRRIDTHAADEAIVRTIALMAGTLGIAVAAEGVETGAQLARLLALGCEEWQGHHFSPPLEAEDFEKLFQPGAKARSVHSV